MAAGAQDVWVSALDTFIQESCIDFGRGSADVREYTWLHPTADDWTSDAYYLHMCLTPRPGPSLATYLDIRPRAPERIGRIMFVPPGHAIRSGCGQGRLRSLQCMLAPEMIDDHLPRRPEWSSVTLAEGLRLNNPEIEWLLLRIYRELKESAFAGAAMVETLANALSIALIRQFGLDRETARRAAGGLPAWRLRRIRERVQANEPAPSLSELAELCDMSVRHLCRAFKAETGQTVAKFIEQTMVERAFDLLAGADMPIAEVARTLGFSNAANFAHAFRRATGFRPSEVEGRRRSAVRRPRVAA